MRTRDAVGRKIVAIRQTRFYNGELRQHVTTLESITLDNGVVIVLHPHEHYVNAYVTASLVRPDE